MTHLSLLGEALSEFYYRKITDEPLHYIRNSDGFCADFDMAEWFETVYFPAIESDAMSMCRGAVLDLGAAAGRHSLALQSRGIVDVCAVDILSTAVEIMRLRGVQNAFVLDVMDRTLYSIGDRSSSNNTAQHSSSSSSSSSSSATVSSQSLQFMDNDEPRLNLDAPMFNEHADNKGRTLADHVKALLRKRYDVDDWTRCTATGVFDTIIMLSDTIGMVGTLGGLRELLLNLKAWLAPGGKVLFDCSDIDVALKLDNGRHAAYARTLSESTYVGEMTMHLEYRTRVGESVTNDDALLK